MAELVELGSATVILNPRSYLVPLVIVQRSLQVRVVLQVLKLSRFQSPRRSELTRKRKIHHNPSSASRRKSKPSCSTDPKSVTQLQRVQGFPDEGFTVPAGKLFWTACREELSLKLSIITNHVKSSKHVLGKEALPKREVRERDIAQAMKRYDQEVHPIRETLPESQRVFRVK